MERFLHECPGTGVFPVSGDTTAGSRLHHSDKSNRPRVGMQFCSDVGSHNRQPPGPDISAFVNTVGAGGGASNCTTSDGATVASCTGGYAKPSWQAGVTGIPADAKRDIPDVSFFASPGFLGSAYLICVSANGACLTSVNPPQEPTAQEIGGTSAASPAMAGVMALINQKAGSPQGNPNAELYTLGQPSRHTRVASLRLARLRTVATSTMSIRERFRWRAPRATPNCTVSQSGDAFGILSGYSGTVGFDLATGLGSLNVANVSERMDGGHRNGNGNSDHRSRIEQHRLERSPDGYRDCDGLVGNSHGNGNSYRRWLYLRGNLARERSLHDHDSGE